MARRTVLSITALAVLLSALIGIGALRADANEVDYIELTVSIDFGGIKRELSIKAEPTDTVAQIKDGIAEELGIPADAQVMVMGEVMLEDAKTVADYAAKDGDTLLLYSVCKDSDHSWVTADCVTPKTCGVCGVTEGDVAGHNWIAANCVTPKTCSVCGAKEGAAAGHTWSDADCITPKVCSVCGSSDGEPSGHSYDNDCDGECNVCSQPREVSGHIDPDENMICDKCEAEISMDESVLGVPGAIAVGVAVLAVGAFVVISVLKKKK